MRKQGELPGLNRRLRTLARVLVGRVKISETVPEAQLDTEYREGRWSYLRSDEQSPRYDLVANLCRRFAPQGALLDIGCGEGILLEHLADDWFSSYTGVDVSGEALEKAKVNHSSRKAAFVRCNAETYEHAGGRVDAIVFNEVLNFSKSPAGLIEKYVPLLTDTGVIVVSITTFHEAAWKEVVRKYRRRIISDLALEDRMTGKAWHLIVIARR
jgi:2-polyprenyl-3-methyl-5-hydroxy-6-metoxy-1,4-benzoquinol methylase